MALVKSGNNRWSQFASKNFPNIPVTIQAYCVGHCTSFSTHKNWKMYLERHNGSYWDVIGSRTGYVSSSSPSHRTFTNVRRSGLMRVRTILLEKSDNSTKALHLYSQIN